MLIYLNGLYFSPNHKNIPPESRTKKISFFVPNAGKYLKDDCHSLPIHKKFTTTSNLNNKSIYGWNNKNLNINNDHINCSCLSTTIS